jgi:hypothetical protein
MTTAHQLILELTVVTAFAVTLWALFALRQENRLRCDAEAHLDDLLNDYEENADSVLSQLRDIQHATFRSVYDWENE